MSRLDVSDPAELEAALDALTSGCWVEVETAGETFRLVRVPGGWHLPGDLTIASGDVVDGGLGASSSWATCSATTPSTCKGGSRDQLPGGQAARRRAPAR